MMVSLVMLQLLASHAYVCDLPALHALTYTAAREKKHNQRVVHGELAAQQEPHIFCGRREQQIPTTGHRSWHCQLLDAGLAWYITMTNLLDFS